MMVMSSTPRRTALFALLVLLLAHTGVTYTFIRAPRRGCDVLRTCGAAEQLPRPYFTGTTTLCAAPSDDVNDVNSSPAPLASTTTRTAAESAAVLVPAPLNSLVDVNLERRTVVYEVTLGRDLGIDIVQGPGGAGGSGGTGGARVGAVEAGSRAAELGVVVGDLIVATSATAGDSLWVHDNADRYGTAR